MFERPGHLLPPATVYNQAEMLWGLASAFQASLRRRAASCRRESVEWLDHSGTRPGVPGSCSSSPIRKTPDMILRNT